MTTLPPAPTPAAATRTLLGDCVLDSAAQRLTRDGIPVPLPPRYFAVLAHLAFSGGRLVTKDELLDAVWGHRSVSDSALKVAINAVRAALRDDPRAPRHVETVARRGYRYIGVATPLPGGPEASTSLPAPTAGGPPKGNLPAPQGGLVGRQADVAAVHHALAAHRLITLHGPGGVGKTRLALAAAAHAAPPDGVWLLRLDALADAGPLLATLAHTLGLPGGAEASAAALARAVATQRLRLVVDNAEHLLPAVADLAATLLAEAPQVQLLVTSQVPLRVAGEVVLPVAPLALPAEEGGGIPHSAALQLLLERARQQQPDLSCEGSDRADAVAICHALDGLPLALELAAARVPLLGWAGVRARLGEQLTLLTRGRTDAVDRHRTLRAALSWTCGLLKPHELRALQSLTVLAGSFTLETALAVVGEDPACPGSALDTLDTLRERSLLVQGRVGAVPRWRLYDSVRAHAAEGLHARGGHRDALARLVRHLTLLFEQADRDHLQVTLPHWLAALQPEIDNLRAALRLALAEPSLQHQAVRLFVASTHFRVRGGWRTEILRDHAAIERLLQDPSPAVCLSTLERAGLGLSAGMMGALGQLLAPAQALQSVLEALPVLRADGDTLREARALTMACGLLLRLQRPPDERAALLQRMRELEAPDWGPLQRRHRAWQEALLIRDQGDLPGFEARCRQIMANAAAHGDEHSGWVAAEGLAQALCAHERTEEAVSLLGWVVEERRRAGLLRQDAHVLAQWAGLRVTLAGDASAQQALHEAVVMMRADGRLWWMADMLAWLPAWQGRWDDAARVQAWADALVRQRGDKRGPMSGSVRARFGRWLGAHPEAGRLTALLSEPPGLDEATVVGLVFPPRQARTG